MATQVLTAQVGFEYGRGGMALDRAPVRTLERAMERNQVLMAAQQRARRGPTPEALFAKRFDNTRLVKAPDPQRTREMRTFACAMALMLGLLMMYGWQTRNRNRKKLIQPIKKEYYRSLPPQPFVLHKQDQNRNNPKYQL